MGYGVLGHQPHFYVVLLVCLPLCDVFLLRLGARWLHWFQASHLDWKTPRVGIGVISSYEGGMFLRSSLPDSLCVLLPTPGSHASKQIPGKGPSWLAYAKQDSLWSWEEGSSCHPWWRNSKVVSKIPTSWCVCFIISYPWVWVKTVHITG